MACGCPSHAYSSPVPVIAIELSPLFSPGPFLAYFYPFPFPLPHAWDMGALRLKEVYVERCEEIIYRLRVCQVKLRGRCVGNVDNVAL